MVHEIKDMIKSHKKFYIKRIRPIEMKYYALIRFRHRITSAISVTKQYIILPSIRRAKGRKYTQNMRKLHNIHKGKRIFVIANGTSVRNEDLLKLQNEITIGVNGIIVLKDRIGWKPNYYCFGDKEVWFKWKKEIQNAGYDNILLSYKMKKYESEFSFMPYYYEGYVRFRDVIFHHLLGWEIKEMEFSDDMFLKGAYTEGRSVITIAVQLAAYMGASEIYLYGQDCDYAGSQHYFDHTINTHFATDQEDAFRWSQSIFTFYRAARKYCDQHNIMLCNATRGGKLEELVRVDFDQLVK